MSATTTVVLSLTTFISTASALAMWTHQNNPTMISRLIVHIILLMIVLPLVCKLLRGAMAIDRLRRHFRITVLYFLLIALWVFLLGYDWYSTGSLISIKSFVHSQSQRPSISPVQRLWYNGFSLAPMTVIGSAYDYLFQLVIKSQLFWQYLIPALFILIIYDWGVYIYEDYYILFKDLGLGGSGTSMRGWALARLRAFVANVDVLRPPRVPQTQSPYRGRLHFLPQRNGPRPSVCGVTPQRQVDFPAPPNIQVALETLLPEFVTSEAGHVIEIRQSFLEAGLRALRRRLTIPTDERGGPLDPRAAFNTPDTFGGEIAHFHREGTSHVVLHPEDCRRVIESGWGERHPFCTTAWYWKLYFNWYLGIRLPVPETLMIVYTPRNQGEFRIIRQIVQAAVWYATNGELHSLDANTYPLPPAPDATNAS